MSINSNSPTLVVEQSLSNGKTASATDRHVGQLRHESNLHSANQAKVAWEREIREEANMEIGRARNISRVV